MKHGRCVFAQLTKTCQERCCKCKKRESRGHSQRQSREFVRFAAFRPRRERLNINLRHEKAHATDAGQRKGVHHMFNNIGPVGLILIAVVVLVLFGRGKVSSLMGEVGKGITAFKKGVDDGKNEIDEAVAAKDVTPEEEKDKA